MPRRPIEPDRPHVTGNPGILRGRAFIDGLQSAQPFATLLRRVARSNPRAVDVSRGGAETKTRDVARAARRARTADLIRRPTLRRPKLRRPLRRRRARDAAAQVRNKRAGLRRHDRGRTNAAPGAVRGGTRRTSLMPSPEPAGRPGGPFAVVANQPYVLLVATMLMWSGNIVTARAVVGIVPPLALAQMRWTIAFLVILPFAWRHLKADMPALLARRKTIVLLGVLGVGAYNTLVYVGLQSTTAVNATILSSIFPLVIAACGFALYRDMLTPAQLLGILVACAGAAVVLSDGDISALTSFGFTPGDLWILAAQVAYALYTVKLRERPVVHPLSFLAAVFFVGQLALVPFSLGEWLSGTRTPLVTETVLAVIYTAIFPSILAYLCFNRGVAILGSNRAGVFFHLIPVLGALMGVAFLGERVGLHHVAGWFLILGGIAAAQMGGRLGATR